MKWRPTIWCQRIYHFILYFIAILLIVAAIIFTLTRSLTPLLNSHRDLFERLTTRLVHNPVDIGRIQLGWRGVQPEILLKNVTIYHAENHVEFLHIQRFYLAVDLIHSLWFRKLLPSVITVDGVNLSIQQINNKTYLINDVTLQSKNQDTAIDLKKLQDWFLGQNTVSLQNISIDFIDKNKAIYPLKIQILTLVNNGLKHKLIGSVNLRNTTSSLNLVLNAKGDLKDIEHLRIVFYGSAKNVDLQKWIAQNSYYGYRLVNGFGQLEAWLNWDHSHWQTQIVKLKLHDVQLRSLQNQQVSSIKNLSGDFSWRPLKNFDGWQISGLNLQITTPSQRWPETQFIVQKNNFPNQTSTIKSSVKYVNLGEMRYLLQGSNLFNEKIQQLLQGMAFTGTLQDVAYEQVVKFNQITHYHFQAKLNDLSVKNWQTIPGINHIDATIQATQNQGTVVLNGKKSLFSMSTLFNHPILFDQITTKVMWQQLATKDWRITINPLMLANPDLEINSYAQMVFNKESKLPYLNLQAKAELNNPAKLALYLPTQGIGAQAQTWLDQAFLSGKPVIARVLLKGNLAEFPFNHEQDSVFQVDAQIQDLDLRYASEWPILQHLKGDLHFSDSKMVANIDSGSTLTTALHQAQVIIPEIKKKTPIKILVTTQATDTAQHLLDFLQSTPLSHSVGKTLQRFKVEGPGNLDLQLVIPLANITKTEVKGVMHLSQNAFYLKENINGVTNLNGDFNFSEKEISAPQLNGVFLNEPIDINIKTDHQPQNNDTAIFHFASVLDIQQLKSEFFPELNLAVTGKSNITGELTIPFSPQSSQKNFLHLNSNLVGIALGYPEPFSKIISDSLPLDIKINFAENEPLKILFNLGDRLHSAWLFTQNNKKINLYAANININNQVANIPEKKGVIINGTLSVLNWDTWQPFLIFNRAGKSNKPNVLLKELMNLPFLANLHVDLLKLGALTFSPADIKVERANASWVNTLTTPKVAGVITIPDGYPQLPIIANFKRIYLDPLSKNNDQPIKIDPKVIPIFKAVIDDLQYNNKDIGQVNLEVGSLPDGIVINKLNVREPLLSCDLRGKWENVGNGQTKTTLFGNISSPNLQGLFNMWDFKSSLIATHAVSMLNFEWQDAPYNFTLKNLSGESTIQLDNGWIIDLDEATTKKLNMGRLLTLLSVRHFMFHINDLSRQGYSFDSLTAHLKFHSGVVTTQDLNTKGVVADIKAEGSVNLIEKMVNLKLGLIVNATSSLPVIATIASGFNPIVGVATWIADKAIHKAMTNVNHYSYSIDGPWSNPTVTELNPKNKPDQINHDEDQDSNDE